MNDLRIDIAKFKKQYCYEAHWCRFGENDRLIWCCKLNAIYHEPTGYLLCQNIKNRLQFVEFCNAFDIGSEVFNGYFRAEQAMKFCNREKNNEN